MSETDPITIFWLRRDLRLNDNVGLYHALSQGRKVLCLFVFDTVILNDLEDRADPRLTFIYDRLSELDFALHKFGGGLCVKHGRPLQVLQELARRFRIESIYANRDYEPYAVQRDGEVEAWCSSSNISFHTCKDHVIFERDEVVKKDGKPYTVYTPYMRQWKRQVTRETFSSLPSDRLLEYVMPAPWSMPTLKEINFERSAIEVPDAQLSIEVLRAYQESRDIPSLNGTTRLSTHLRFGTVSIRQIARLLSQHSETLLNEIIWREFFAQILYHFPRVVDRSFRPKYDRIKWRNDQAEFEAWCAGRTGYPIVDAGMRELARTGYMHNRVRMVTASFLCKHLLIDWRWGEAWFARKLLDFDLASNNGNWQWAAGTGCDAAPYFRVFNPWTQQKKFDPALTYIRQWVPEIDTDDYPEPIVEHKFARERALDAYRKVV